MADLNEKFAFMHTKRPTRGGKSEDEIRARNKINQQKWYQNAREKGAPSYLHHQRRNRANYYRRLQAKLPPADFLVRLARLKMRNMEAYKEVFEDLNLS